MTRNRRGAGLSPFLEAAESGNWELAFHYLDRGADPYERAPDGKTAPIPPTSKMSTATRLCTAPKPGSRYGFEEVVKALKNAANGC